MSLNIKYYADAGMTKEGRIGVVRSQHDLGPEMDTPMSQRDCKNFCYSDSQMGVYLDLGAQPIGNRPVYTRYKVGDCNKLSASTYVQPGLWGCRQPCWTPQCK